jgi:hypothetical protein
MGEQRLTVHDLRHRWLPIKDRLHAQRSDHPTPIRFHRACSWLQRVEAIPEGEDLDLRLVCQWIAFNALYNQWNPEQREPQTDREGWRRFLARILKLDTENQVRTVLEADKKLVLAILDDAYLGDFFWRDPSVERALRGTRNRKQAPGWYVAGQWGMILENLVDRIYLLRCQLLHGAATHGSRLNRTSLRRCCMMLDDLLPAILLVIVDHGADEDWGPLCYPPQQ